MLLPYVSVFGPEACGILAPGAEPVLPKFGRWRRNHWIARKVPGSPLLNLNFQDVGSQAFRASSALCLQLFSCTGRQWPGRRCWSVPGVLVLFCHFSRVQLVATPWTAARRAPLSMGFSRQECWRGLPFPSPGDLPDPELEPVSLDWQVREVLYH